jgi:hypothetical protein
MNPEQQEKLATIQASEEARKEGVEKRRAELASNQMSPWSGPEYRAELESIVAQQKADNPNQTTREMLMLRKIHNADTEKQRGADEGDGITRNAEGVPIIPRAEELAMKWTRHQSQDAADADYKMKPEELAEYQITLMKSQPKGLDAMTKNERMTAAADAAASGNMEEYARIRRASR